LSRRFWLLGELEAFDRRRTVEAALKNQTAVTTAPAD
jgi:hypothetical protein